MTQDLLTIRTEIGRCLEGLTAALRDWRSTQRFAADLRLAADAARALCACEPAAWGDAPAAIARLLLPHRQGPGAPTAPEAAASHWALHLFALLSTAPTIKRALIDVAPVYAAGESLSRLRKRVDEVAAIVNALQQPAEPLPELARITFGLIALDCDLLKSAMLRDAVDLRLIEYAAADIAARAGGVPARSAPRMFQDLAERADAAVWESNRLIQSPPAGGRRSRAA